MGIEMRRFRQWRLSLAAVAVVFATGLASPVRADSAGHFLTSAGQPANVGDAILGALAYHDSGAYDADVALVAAEAGNWIAQRAGAVARPALVLDIDETSLSNWEVIKRDNFGRPGLGPCDPGTEAVCGWAAWDQLGKDPAIAPTLAVFQAARAAKVTVFFITGRPENQRAATERNLAAAGYTGYEKLYMVPDGKHFPTAADFKAPVRAEIAGAGYTIIANMGDQPSDLEGGHTEKAFLLPNPFYRVP